MSNIQQLLNDFVMDYSNPFKIYELAKEYDKLEQNAAAFTYFLRAAEFCEGDSDEEKLLQYKALILGGKCFEDEGNRQVTVYSLYKHAITVLPERPEAYYYMCNYLEKNEEWKESLLYATLGLNYIDVDDIGDDAIQYPGPDALRYHHASGSWKDNGQDASKRLFFNLVYSNTPVLAEYSEKALGWMNNIGWPSSVPYTKDKIRSYKFPFPGIDKIEKNYARHYQDMFVLSALDGRENGTFVEIGSGLPYKANNTALLEDEFGWKGISIDNSERFCQIFSNERKSTIVLADGSQVNYTGLFNQACLEDWIDFLRINAEQASIETLKRIPFGRFSYGVIQFQHNACWWGPAFREESRKILKQIGYVLMVNDVSMDLNSNYEDWWVHPQIAHQKQHMISNKEKNFIYDYVTKGR